MITSANGHLVAERLHRWRSRQPALSKSGIAVLNGEAYAYAPIDDIIAFVSKPLSRFGLYVVQTVTGDIGVCTRICHTSGEWIEDTVIVSAKTMDDKGAAITRLRRYALITMLGLPTVDAPKEVSAIDSLLSEYNDATRTMIVRIGLTQYQQQLSVGLHGPATIDSVTGRYVPVGPR